MELVNGIYRARATHGALGETSTGKERVAVEFSLLDEGHVGTRITWHGYFTEKTLETTIKALRACGWQGDDLMDLAGIDDNEVSLVVENETYEGRTVPKVRWVNTATAITTTRITSDKAKAFAAKMRGQIAALSGGNNRSRTTETKKRAPAPSAAPGDDLPF